MLYGVSIVSAYPEPSTYFRGGGQALDIVTYSEGICWQRRFMLRHSVGARVTSVPMRCLTHYLPQTSPQMSVSRVCLSNLVVIDIHLHTLNYPSYCIVYILIMSESGRLATQNRAGALDRLLEMAKDTDSPNLRRSDTFTTSSYATVDRNKLAVPDVSSDTPHVSTQMTRDASSGGGRLGKSKRTWANLPSNIIQFVPHFAVLQRPSG